MRGKNEAKRWQKVCSRARTAVPTRAEHRHNDLKCNNILISGDGDSKTTNFALRCISNSTEVKMDQKRQGAQRWESSEYLGGDRLTLASDSYGFAMCILEAVTGMQPWGPHQT